MVVPPSPFGFMVAEYGILPPPIEVPGNRFIAFLACSASADAGGVLLKI
jgi:hypothetical protein